MKARKFALYSGILYLILGIASLLPMLSTRPAGLPPLHLDVSYGLFLGVFPQNILNKVAILAFGAFGLFAYFNAQSARISVLYARSVFFVMGAAALLGCFPATDSFFGFWPLWGAEAVLHAANAFLGGYFGFNARTEPRPVGVVP